MPLLIVKNLSVYFPVKRTFYSKSEKKYLFQNLNFDINEGEIVSLMGKSGIGKSTLAKTLWGLHKNYSGEIIFKCEGKNGIQGVFQSPHDSLDPKMTVESMLKESSKIVKKELSSNLMVMALKKVGLQEEFLKRYPHELSGGECQRVSLARSLFLGAKLIILDEALRSLDMINQKIIINLIKEISIRERVAFLFITHDEVLADTIGTKKIIISS